MRRQSINSLHISTNEKTPKNYIKENMKIGVSKKTEVTNQSFTNLLDKFNSNPPNYDNNVSLY